jgi:diguanylate cyclase (GGDEF)-like protein
MKLKVILQTLILSVTLACFSTALSPAQHYSFSDSSSGLDNLNISCAARDNDGFLWIGTDNGLYRFDGAQYTRIGAAQGMTGRSIQDIFIGPDGSMLVGTTGEIFFRGQNGQFEEVGLPASGSHFILSVGSVFTESPAGQILVADRNGVYQLRRNSASAYRTVPLQLLGTHIWSVLYDEADTLWYGCDEDLCKLSGGKNSRVSSLLHLPHEHWLHMLIDSHKHLWLRGDSHIEEIDPTQNKAFDRNLPGSTETSLQVSFTMDRQGQILTNRGADFGLWENGHWRMITPRNGLPDIQISTLITDHDGSLWIGLAGHGLMHWTGQGNWEAYTRSEGLSDDIVWSTLRDHAGRLWIATVGGLDWIAPGSVQAQSWLSPGLNTKHPQALAMDQQGNVWMGTAEGLLVRINPQSKASGHWKLPTKIYSILVDPQGRLWIGTLQGLYLVSPDTEVPVLVKTPVFPHPTMRFRSLCLGNQGEIWAASEEAIYRMDVHGWSRIDPGLGGVVPSHIAADQHGNLWAMGSFNGLVRLRISGNRIIESEHILRPQLLSEQVVDLFVDSRDWLWVGQDAGLTVFNGHSWRSFTRNDGLIWNDIDSYGLSEDRDGSLWIGTSGGLAHLLHPEIINTPHLHVPSIALASFGSTPLHNGATVLWSDSQLDLQLATLNFLDGSQPHIRYRLLGLEENWLDTENEKLLYHRLPPGHYILQAQTVDPTSATASSTAEFEFWIAPRWWQSWQIKAVLLLACLLLPVLLWRWRVHILLWQKHQLQAAILLRTQDLEAEKAELLRTRELLRHYAEHDDLTGLLNHRVIEDRLHGEIERCRREQTPLSILMLDLDRFKQINDTYGHPAGDAVLSEIGAVLLRSVRSYDWVGRYGGEEFLLILPGSGFTAARARAEQIRLAIQATAAQDKDHVLQVTASMGVASGFPCDAQSMIRAADSALYRAKNNGRNCVVAVEVLDH